MTIHTSKAYERLAVVGTIDPDAYTAATYLTDAVDMLNLDELLVCCLVGTMASTSTVDFSVTQATTSGGTYKAVTGKAATQLTEAGTDSDKQVVISVRGEDLDMDNNYRFVKVSMVVAAAASDAAVLVLAQPKSGLASSADLASVDEMV